MDLLCSSLQALHLVDVMEDDGVAPDVATWSTLLSAAKYLGQPNAAEMVSCSVSACPGMLTSRFSHSPVLPVLKTKCCSLWFKARGSGQLLLHCETNSVYLTARTVSCRFWSA